MRYLQYFAIAAFAILIALPLHAEEMKGGLNYTTMKHRKKDNNAGTLQIKTMNYDQGQTAKEEEEEDAASKVWKRYKALAAGEPEQEAEAPKEKKLEPLPDVLPKPTGATAQTPPKETGFAAIIDEYKKQKSQRSQMRSMTISRPEPPKVQAPEKESAENDSADE